MKKLAKFLGIILGSILILLIVTCSVISKSLPEGAENPRTDELIEHMWKALNKPAWDSTKYVRWTFLGKNHYHWDKAANLAQIEWGANKVLLNPDTQKGIAFTNGAQLTGKKADKIIEKAWSNWCNDMFWLTAPFKVQDQGTKQTLVQDDLGEGIKVTYTGGGVTPGDSYIWRLGEDYKPISYEMYVKILPMKGIEVPWGGWVELSTGAWLSSEHTFSGMKMKLENIAGGMEWSDIGLESDIWAAIRE